MNIAVFGTGAMGCWLAARLTPLADCLTVVGTWREALDAIDRSGIAVDEAGRRSWARPRTAALGAPLPPCDFAIVLVKSHQTHRVAAAAARAGDRIVTLQNGLGNREALEAVAGTARVRSGVVTAGARVMAPGHIEAFPGQIVLEVPPGDESMPRLASLLQAAHIPTRTTADIAPHVWRKLAVNCAINPLSCVLGVANGTLLEEDSARATMEAAAREVAAVAHAWGVALEGDPAAWAIEVARRTAGNRSSMLQDLDRGAQTEIDALCGAVVREGRRLGVPTPVNERLWREVRAIEQARAGRGAPSAQPAGVSS